MIINKTLNEIFRMKNNEGIVLQGCGGNLIEWIDGINEMLNEDEILLSDTKFEKAIYFENGNIGCLFFDLDDVDFDMSKLAIWRLATRDAFGSMWLSDYIDNFAPGLD